MASDYAGGLGVTLGFAGEQEVKEHQVRSMFLQQKNKHLIRFHICRSCHAIDVIRHENQPLHSTNVLGGVCLSANSGQDGDDLPLAAQVGQEWAIDTALRQTCHAV